METIWKFTLLADDRNEFDMPRGAEILCAQVQYGEICIWAKVKPDQPSERRFFEVFGTGHSVTVDMGIMRNYIGTVQLNDGALVFHVFERTN